MPLRVRASTCVTPVGAWGSVIPAMTPGAAGPPHRGRLGACAWRRRSPRCTATPTASMAPIACPPRRAWAATSSAATTRSREIMLGARDHRRSPQTAAPGRPGWQRRMRRSCRTRIPALRPGSAVDDAASPSTPPSEGTVYCCACIDAFSRDIVGWAIDEHPDDRARHQCTRDGHPPTQC
jgi:hypothetical protein